MERRQQTHTLSHSHAKAHVGMSTKRIQWKTDPKAVYMCFDCWCACDLYQSLNGKRGAATASPLAVANRATEYAYNTIQTEIHTHFDT